MSKFIIPVSSGLIDIKHYQKMGNAIWLFEWLIDKTTKVGKNKEGMVLGGMPITIKYLQKHFMPLHYNTLNKHMTTLIDWGYIQAIRTPCGYRIGVNKNIRHLKVIHTKMGPDSHKRVNPFTRTCESNIRYNRDYTEDLPIKVGFNTIPLIIDGLKEKKISVEYLGQQVTWNNKRDKCRIRVGNGKDDWNDFEIGDVKLSDLIIK
jgi:hypothetical protein